MATIHPRITFETDTCGRCAGSGTYPSAAWNGVCLGCSGSGKKLTRRGRAARMAYDAVMAEMEVPAPDIAVGDLIQVTVSMAGAKRWERVTELVENSGVGYGDPVRWLPGLVTKSGRFSFDPDADKVTMIRRWSDEVRARATARVARMAGATVEGAVVAAAAPESVPAPVAPKSIGRGSHAECDHPTTPRDRAACRKRRAAGN